MTANASHVTEGMMTSQSPSKLSEVTMWLMVYVIPVIFCFGIFGNLVSLVVFLSEKMRRVSTNVYLAALSASNTVLLLAVAVSHLVGLKLVHHNGLCQAAVYLTCCAGFLSVWLVVCISVENFVMTFFLHKAPRHCMVRRALGVVALLCVTSFLLHNFALWTTRVASVNISETVTTQYCHTDNRYHQSIVQLFTFIDVTVTLVVPTVVILALVIPTVVKCIWRNYSRGDASVRVVLSRKERALLRVTRLLVVMTVSFVVLTAPTHLNKLRHLFRDPGPSDMLVIFIFQVFYHLSFSMNFVYFLVWGKNFRGRFCHMFVAVYKLFISLLGRHC